MSQPTDFTARPAMSDADTELTLVACDGTKFSVGSTQLERLSDVFRSMLELPKPDAADTTVHLSEDATTLRALLDLAAQGVGLAGRINSLSLSQLERLMTAADKYDIPSARPIVASCLQQRTDDLDARHPDDQDPWHLFGIVKRFGFTDLEASVRLKLLQTRLDSTPYPSYLSGADVYNVMLERKQRVDEFCYALTSESWDAPFAVYNRQFHICPSCGIDVSDAYTAAWSAVKVAVILAYNTEPYVEVLLQNEDFLQGPLKQLYETTCTTRRSYLSSCGQSFFPEGEVECRLRDCEGFKSDGRTTRF